MVKSGITKQFLKEHLEYQGGHLFWVKHRGNVKIGQQFGNNHSKGYRHGKLKGESHYEHRLIWLYHNGEWPTYIDHINGIKDDNRIENLRECTSQQNSFNRKSGKSSSSKYKGVCWSKQRKKWVANYTYKSKTHHIGLYETEEAAAEAYRKFTENLHQGFANYE